MPGTFWKVNLGSKVLIIVPFGMIRVFTVVLYCWSKSCRVLNRRKMPPLFFDKQLLFLGRRSKLQYGVKQSLPLAHCIHTTGPSGLGILPLKFHTSKYKR